MRSSPPSLPPSPLVSSPPSSTVYIDDFEAPFLERTAEFYAAEARRLGERGGSAAATLRRRPGSPSAAALSLHRPLQPPITSDCPLSNAHSSQAADYIATCDCPTYLAHAERRLGEEAERVGAYMDASTEAKVVKVRWRCRRRVCCCTAASCCCVWLGSWRTGAAGGLTGLTHSLPASLRLPLPPPQQVVEGELVARQMRALADMENSGAVPMLVQASRWQRCISLCPSAQLSL